jgi:peroxiredoxin
MSLLNIYVKTRTTILKAIFFSLAISLLASTSCIKDEKYTHENTTLVNVGDTAPDFSVELLNGNTTTLSSMQGQVVMLIFFSTECPDCQNQFAEIQRLVTAKTPSFKILAISRGESVEATEQFSKKYGITFDVCTDIDLSIYNLYASRYVPRNFLISPAGRVEALTVEYNPDELHAIWNKAEAMGK